ncbi:MAG: pilin [Methanobacteriota archaeon]
MNKKKIQLTCMILTALTGNASAFDLNEGLMTLAAALATFMIALQGLRWLMSESPKGRAEAKKGLIWTIVGLIVAYLAFNLVCGLYCHALQMAYGGTIACGPPCP